MPPKNNKGASPAVIEDSDSDSKKISKSTLKIANMKKKREKDLTDVVNETRKELSELGSQLEGKRKKQRQERAEEQAKHITTLVENMERRKEIEKKMQTIVNEMQERVEEVEQMILVGYDGRLDAMDQALKDNDDEVTKKSHEKKE